MKIAVVTTFYPNAADPLRAVFVRNLVNSMGSSEEVRVISPVACTHAMLRASARASLRSIPASDRQQGVEVAYPRFLALPGLSFLNGLSIMVAVIPLLRDLRRRGEVDIVHAHCAYPDAVGAALAAGIVGIPLLITAHGSDINVYARRPLLAPQIRWALRRAGGIIGVSRALCDRIAALVPERKTCIRQIPCAGIDPAVFRPGSRSALRAQRGISAQARVVSFVGQLVPIKGVELLIEAWRLLLVRGVLGEHDRLLLVGEGPLRESLQAAAAAAVFGDTVRFLGGLQQGDIAQWLASSDLLCLPSRNEGLPNVIVEALACGIPVVASAVGGIPEIIAPEVNGVLFPPGDAAALADALAHALARRWDGAAIADGAAGCTWRSLAARNIEFLSGIHAGCPQALHS
jgi:glycosyltransferase involved in cell wall biosynthesis